MILTNDGGGQQTHAPAVGVPKTYVARVRGKVSRRALGTLRQGVDLEDGPTSPADVRLKKQSAKTALVEITIHEGRKRQVRRMFVAVGLPVEELSRRRYGPLTDKGLEPAATASSRAKRSRRCVGPGKRSPARSGKRYKARPDAGRRGGDAPQPMSDAALVASDDDVEDASAPAPPEMEEPVQRPRRARSRESRTPTPSRPASRTSVWAATRSDVMTVRFIPELAGITPYQPGLPIEVVQRRFGLEQVVKLASNEFPLPPFPEVKEVVMAALDRLQRYPDGFSTDLREALAAVYDRSPEQITIGCGTCELLYLLAHSVLERGDEVVLARPSFTSYRDVIAIRGAVPVAVPLQDYTHDLEAMAAGDIARTKMIFVCNPNNPTGTYVPSAEVARLVERPRRRHGRDRRGVHRVRDRRGPRGLPGHPERARQRRRPAHLLQDLRALRPAHRVRHLRAGGEGRRSTRCGSPSTSTCSGSWRPSRRSSTRIRWRSAARPTRGSATSWSRGLRSAGAPRSPPGELHARRDEDLCDPHDKVCGTLLSLGAIVRDGNALGCPGWARVTVGTEEEIEFFLDKLASLEVGDRGSGEGRRL